MLLQDIYFACLLLKIIDIGVFESIDLGSTIDSKYMKCNSVSVLVFNVSAAVQFINQNKGGVPDATAPSSFTKIYKGTTPTEVLAEQNKSNHISLFYHAYQQLHSNNHFQSLAFQATWSKQLTELCCKFRKTVFQESLANK